MLRISASILLMFCMLYAPFWVYAPLILLGMVYFVWFWEGVALFLLSDLLYGIPEVRFLGIVFISFIISTLLLIGLEFLKKRLKFYNHKR